jgi:hypothetical protein
VICVIAIVFSAVRGAQTRPESITGAPPAAGASRAADAVSAGRG